MKLTTRWLTQRHACPEGIAWFTAQKATAPITVLTALMAEDKLDWAHWLLVRCLTYRQSVSYAIFAAEQVLDLYEKHYPTDARPRQAIDAAKACLTHPSKKNKAAAWAAAWAAWAAAGAAWAATGAAWAAAGAATGAAAEATGAAARAADEAACGAMQRKILEYGMTLLP